MITDLSLPPQNIECEETVLGGILLDPKAFPKVAHTLKAEDFYVHSHQEIYKAVVDLHKKKKPTDLMTVSSWLQDRHLLDEVGGIPRLLQLIDRTVSAANIDRYSELLIEKSTRRQLIEAGGKIVEMAHDTFTELDEVLASSVESLNKVVVSRSLGSEDCRWEFPEVWQNYYEHFDNPIHSISTGLSNLDTLTGGLLLGDYSIVAARPSMGKSWLANWLALSAARKGYPVLYFTSEMDKRSVGKRMISTLAKVPLSKIIDPRKNPQTPEEQSRIAEAYCEYENLPITLIDKPGSALSHGYIKSECERMILKYKNNPPHQRIGLVLQDYIQLMGDSGSESRVGELSQISKSFKAIARDYRTHVCVLSQLNRGVESRNDKRPLMSDLRECLTRNAMLTLAETGERVSIADVKPGMLVLAVSKNQKVVPAMISRSWNKGVKPVYRLTTKTGREIECTDNHPILTQRGYVQLKDLQSSDVIATALKMECPQSSNDDPLKARLLGYLVGNGSLINSLSFCTPCIDVRDDFLALVNKYFPGASFNVQNKTGNCWEIDVAYHHVKNHGKPFGNPLRNWLRSLGLINKRAPEKFCPEWVFTLGAKGAIEFLTGLLYTDGSVKISKANSSKVNIDFDTSSRVLASDILQLLTRAGIVASLHKATTKQKDHHHFMYRIALSEDTDNLLLFAYMVEKVGYKGQNLNLLIESLTENPKKVSGHSAFTLPKEVSTLLNQKTLALRQQGIKRDPNTLGVWRDQGKRLHRSICNSYAKYLQDDELEMWANSDLLWEEVRSAEYIGEQETFDVCVPETGNFLANGITVHNSGGLEQDADLILMPYRDEYYNPDSSDRGIVEMIVRKNRNGETGTVKCGLVISQGEFRSFGDYSSF